MKQKKYQTKSDMVCTLVREDIVKGILRPGTRLIVSNVAKRYGVSEIPVREAFQILAQDGFLNTAPNAGFIVSPLSKNDAKEIFEIREVLECLAARMAVQNISNSDIDSLEQMVEQSREYVESRDFEGYWRQNREFHIAIYRLCGNDRLYHMIVDLYAYTVRYPSYYTQVSELIHSIEEHKIILEAYRRRDEAKVVELMREHTLKTYQHVLRRLDEEADKGQGEK